jgi:hypothetical protein
VLKKAMFERDILYPTDKTFEPGSVHVTVYPPENSGGLPVVIASKTSHNALDYVSEIVDILQADIFDRIRIDIRTSGILYFKPDEKKDTCYRLQFTDKENFTVEEMKETDL